MHVKVSRPYKLQKGFANYSEIKFRYSGNGVRVVIAAIVLSQYKTWWFCSFETVEVVETQFVPEVLLFDC